MNIPPIHIINLPDREDRRARATAQLRPTGLDYHFFPAVNRVDGRRHFSGIDTLTCFLSLGRQPTDAELGCYASHLSLWKRCAESNRPLVVMEDDFSLNDNFVATMHALPLFLQVADYVRLESLARGRFRANHAEPLLVRDGLELCYLNRVPLNMTAYALTPAGARRLIDGSDRFTCPNDNFLQRFWKHGVAITVLRPEAVDLDDLATQSSIVESDRDQKSFGHRLARLLRIPYKAWATLARRRANRSNRLRLMQRADALSETHD